MHGVTKTTLTDEQKEAKRLERQKKRERFLKARDLVLAKLAKGEFDDEGLKVTGAILAANPDLYVFWNYRKRTLLSLEKTAESEKTNTDCDTAVDQATPETEKVSAGDAEHIRNSTTNDVKREPKHNGASESYYRNELSLTEECLRNNPKSYGAWYHRQWALVKLFRQSSRVADLLKSELRHCTDALSLDERNFHCWDHRRFVCRLASVPETDELQFSKTKVDENFSNYSAWHYRSAMLPVLFPPASDDSVLRLEENKLKEELVYVQNAFFTDPEDQSAWFYHCWLFRPMEKKSTTMPSLRYFEVTDPSPRSVIIAFDRPVNLKNRRSPFKTLLDGMPIFNSCDWSNPDGSRSCSVWTTTIGWLDSQNLFKGGTLTIYFQDDVVSEIQFFEKDVEKSGIEYCVSDFADFDTRVIRALQPSLPSAFRDALENSMNSCRELKAVEPTSNKWPSLTEILSMRSLDLLKYESDIMNGLDSLMEADPPKRNYYADLKSKYAVEARLMRCRVENGGGRVRKEFRLDNLGLTALPATGTMTLMLGIHDLNLSNNRLTSVGSLAFLISLRRLRLDGNLLSDTRGLNNLRQLIFLSIASNRLGQTTSTCQAVLEPLKECSKLMELVLTGNPLCQNVTMGQVLNFLRTPDEYGDHRLKVTM